MDTHLSLSVVEIIVLMLGAITLGVTIHFFISSRRSLSASMLNLQGAKPTAELTEWKLRYFNDTEDRDKLIIQLKQKLADAEENAGIFSIEAEEMRKLNKKLKTELEEGVHSGLAALGTDGIVRTHPKARFQRLDDTALYLFIPVLFTLGLGLFLEEVAEGYWTVAIGLISAIPYWFILRAEYDSVDRRAETYHSTRLVLNLATYVIAFLFFATIYDFDLSLLTSAFAAGIVSFLLAIEVLREEEMDTSRTMFYALAIGLLLAETAWATHFLPIDGSAAAVFLLLALYLMTGMMHNYLGDRLNLRTASEFTAVALAGLLVVTVSHSYI